MPRPPRIEYKGAFHHVMNRGRDNQAIYLDDEDYEAFLTTLAEVSKEYDAVIHAYRLMTDFRSCKIRIHPFHGINESLSSIGRNPQSQFKPNNETY